MDFYQASVSNLNSLHSHHLRTIIDAWNEDGVDEEPQVEETEEELAEETDEPVDSGFNFGGNDDVEGGIDTA